MLVTGRTVTSGTASDLKRTIVRLRRFTQVALMRSNTYKTTSRKAERSRQLSQTGVITSLRRLFAKNRDNECNRDITPTIRLSLAISSAFIDLILSCT